MLSSSAKGWIAFHASFVNVLDSNALSSTLWIHARESAGIPPHLVFPVAPNPREDDGSIRIFHASKNGCLVPGSAHKMGVWFPVPSNKMGVWFPAPHKMGVWFPVPSKRRTNLAAVGLCLVRPARLTWQRT